MDNNITISREEYDALKAIFSHAKLSSYNDCGLNFNDIEDVMSILHPEECKYNVKRLAAARGEEDV